MTKLNIANFSQETLFEDLEKDLFTEEFTLKNLDVSARVLQHWSERGLLPDKKRKEDENHKFNFIELIWLKLVLELRLIGFPIERIKKVKKALLEKQSLLTLLNIKPNENIADRLYPILASRIKDKEAFYEVFSSNEKIKKADTFKLSILHLLIILFIDNRYHIKFIVFSDGQMLPYIPEIHDKEPSLVEHIEKETTISIPLFKLILNFMDDERNYNFISKGVILNSNELQILATIRSGKFNKITIHFKDRKPKVIEATELIKISKEARLSEILLNREYEKLEITTNQGNIAYVPKTTKHILK